MSRSVTILIDGKVYRWRDLLDLRREQLAAAKREEQLPLFADLPEDTRPAYERTASGRYQQPSLLTLLEDGRVTPPALLLPTGRHSPRPAYLLLNEEQ